MSPANERAADVVGQGDPSDWSLRPASLPGLFRETAPELAALLGDPRLTATASSYEEHDARAVAAQDAFRRLSWRVSWCILATAVAGALLAGSGLLGAAALDPALHRASIWLLTAASLVAGVTGLVALRALERENMLAEWMTARAAAESGRITYFTELAERALEHDADVQLLVLELFRRYQLEVQEAYYGGRQEQHRASHRRTARLGAAAVALLTLSTAAGGLAGALDVEWLPLAAFGSIGAALAAFSSRREDLTQDGRNAERYRRTALALSGVRESLPEVRRGVAAGRAALLAKFVAAVNEQVSLEHRQWIEQSGALDVAARDLRRALRMPG
jgi:hypothetical protein